MRWWVRRSPDPHHPFDPIVGAVTHLKVGLGLSQRPFKDISGSLLLSWSWKCFRFAGHGTVCRQKMPDGGPVQT